MAVTDDQDIAKLLNLLRSLPDDERRIGLLKRIAAEGGTLDPKWAPAEASGYFYWPAVDRDLRQLCDSDLAYLADRDYLERRYFDRLTRCPTCRSANLNIREVCVSCGSANLFAQPLLHHYRCGYVGAIATFAQDGDARICPKCDGTLRHLGTDHEVVGEQFGCRQCYASFEEPKVEAVCMGCGARTEADKLAHDDIVAYAMTNLGHAAVRGGRLFDRDDEQMTEPDLPVYRRQVALSLLRDEVRRQTRYRIPFSALMFRTGGPATEPTVIRQLREKLRDVDHIGRYADGIVIVLLPATPEAGGKVVLDRILGHLGSVGGTTMSFLEIERVDAILADAAKRL